MYRNVVPARELLSDSFSSERYDQREISQDSQQYSQLAYSQPEFSQISTQDMFTQQFSNGSQNEVNNIPNRKPTLYDKWKSKTNTPFRNIGTEKNNGPINQSSTSRHNQPRSDLSFQQLQINKVKAKERDDRDFLQQVVNTVQDCTKEVRLTLSSVKERLEHNEDRSHQNLQQTISSFLDDLSNQQERILNAVQEKESSTASYHKLEKELAVKEAKIKVLDKTIEEYKRETPEKIINALQKQLRSPQRKVDDKLCELLETMRDNHEQYVRQIQEQKQQLEQQQQLYSDLKKAQQTQIKDSEKRLINELSSLRKDIKKKENTCLQDILDQLKSAQEQQMEELEKHVTGLMEGSAPAPKSSCYKEERVLKKEMQEFMRKHGEGVQRMVEVQFKKHLHLQEQQLAEAVHKITEKEVKDDQIESFLSLPQFEDKMGQYHEDFKKQVESLHERHIQEIKLLKSEMSAKQLKKHEISQSEISTRDCQVSNEKLLRDDLKNNKAEGQLSQNFPGNNESCKDISTWRQNSAIVSPLTANYRKLNTRSFFSKTAPSPVTAVPIQLKCQQATGISIVKEQQLDKTHSKSLPKAKKKRRKKSRFSKPKKPKSAVNRNSVEAENYSQTTQPAITSCIEYEISAPNKNEMPIKSVSKSQTSIPGTRKKIDFTKSLTNNKNMTQSVYDFRDDDLSNQVSSQNIPFFGSRTQRYSYNSKQELMTVNTSQTVTFPRPSESPYQDSMSRDSSPSLSITEMVVKRRIKCNKRSPNIDFNHINPNGFQKIGLDPQFPVYDILSTPTINTVSKSKPFWNYKDNMQPQPQTVKRGTEKRRLCDVSLNNTILQCIQNQSKRICR